MPSSCTVCLGHSDIRECDIDCLDYDAFRFAGAGAVETVYVQNNAFPTLPEKLLWNMTSILYFYARNLNRITGLPEKFFLGLEKLNLIYYCGFRDMGKNLPDGLFRGLTSLQHLSLTNIHLARMPNLKDLTVRHATPCHHLASLKRIFALENCRKPVQQSS